METENLLELSLPELYTLISNNMHILKEQQEFCDRLFLVLEQKKQIEKNDRYLLKIAIAERIEEKIATWLNKNWYRFQFMYTYYKCKKQFDPKKIRTNSHRPHIVLPRMIMIYFIAAKSGLKGTEIADFFELKSHSDVNYAINKIETYMKDERFEKQMDFISNLI